MSSPATVTRQIFDGYDAELYTAPLSTNGDRLRPTMWRQIFQLPAGTYSVANLKKGQSLLLDVQGAATVTNAAGTTIGTFGANQFIELLATSDDGSFTYKTFSADVPVGKFSTHATATTIVGTAADFSGAQHVYWQNTADGALSLETPSALDIISAHQGGSVQGSGSFLLTIVNRGDNTITMTGGDDVTINGEATIATLVTRTYLVEYAATELTMRSVSKGTIET